MLNATNNFIVGKYCDDISDGRRVIVLAHSQGNLFANTTIESVRSIDESYKEIIGMYDVASAAFRQIDGADYVTAEDDIAINALRRIAPVLSANIDNDSGLFNDFRSGLKHEYTTDYFDPRLRSRTEIDDGIEALANDLLYPLEKAGNFAIELDFESEFPEFISFFAVTDPQGVEDIILNRRYELVCNAARLGTYTVTPGSLNAAGEDTEGVSSGTISGRLGNGEDLQPVNGEAGEACDLVDIEISENDDLELDVYDYEVTLLPQDEKGCEPVPPLSEQPPPF